MGWSRASMGTAPKKERVNYNLSLMPRMEEIELDKKKVEEAEPVI